MWLKKLKFKKMQLKEGERKLETHSNKKTQIYSMTTSCLFWQLPFPHSYIHTEPWSLDDDTSVDASSCIMADRILMESSLDGWRDSNTDWDLNWDILLTSKDQERKQTKQKKNA